MVVVMTGCSIKPSPSVNASADYKIGFEAGCKKAQHPSRPTHRLQNVTAEFQQGWANSIPKCQEYYQNTSDTGRNSSNILLGVLGFAATTWSVLHKLN